MMAILLGPLALGRTHRSEFFFAANVHAELRGAAFIRRTADATFLYAVGTNAERSRFTIATSVQLKIVNLSGGVRMHAKTTN